MANRLAVCAALASLALAAIACTTLPAASGPAARAADGRAVFMRNCAACHGEKGDGKSLANPVLGKPPRDFTAPAARENLSREYMIAIVRDGRPHGPMVARQSRLSQEDIEAAVDYIRERFMKPQAGAR